MGKQLKPLELKTFYFLRFMTCCGVFSGILFFFLSPFSLARNGIVSQSIS